jgi:MATE family multidrug resistance protein
VAAAGNQLALTLASRQFMVPLGISSATSCAWVRRSAAGDRAAMARSGFCGFADGHRLMIVPATAFPAGLPRCAGPRAHQTTSPSSPPACRLIRASTAVLQLFDGMQAVGAGALRGAGDTQSGMWANSLATSSVGVRLCHPPGLHLSTWAAPGLWWGLTAVPDDRRGDPPGRFVYLTPPPRRAHASQRSPRRSLAVSVHRTAA